MKKKLYLIFAIMLIAVTLGCALPGTAIAQTMNSNKINPDFYDTVVYNDRYSDVIDDLERDESFDTADYPVVSRDYSIEVFQIAESADGELFVYVYQHMASELCHATSINISTTTGDNLSYSNYELELLSERGTLAKYLVVGLNVKADVVRYYDISSIYRKYFSSIDDLSDRVYDNKVAEVAFAVGKLFTAITYMGETTYTEEHQDVVELRSMYVGNVLYQNGYKLTWGMHAYNGAFSSHFVAFAVENYQIDKLLEADVEFEYQYWLYEDFTWYFDKDFNPRNYVVGKAVPLKKTLKYDDDEVVVEPSGAIHKTYKWNTIQRIEDFLADDDVKFNDSEVAKIKQQQWVLRFHESALVSDSSMVTWKTSMTGQVVSSVTILRLKFSVGKDVYNLGVVSNKQTGSTDPSGETNPEDDSTSFWKNFVNFWKKVGNWLAKYWWIILLALLVIIPLISFLVRKGFKVVFTAIWHAIKWVAEWTLKILWYIISAPARLIVFIANKLKERREVQETS